MDFILLPFCQGLPLIEILYHSWVAVMILRVSRDVASHYALSLELCQDELLALVLLPPRQGVEAVGRREDDVAVGEGVARGGWEVQALKKSEVRYI